VLSCPANAFGKLAACTRTYTQNPTSPYVNQRYERLDRHDRRG